MLWGGATLASKLVNKTLMKFIGSTPFDKENYAYDRTFLFLDKIATIKLSIAVLGKVYLPQNGKLHNSDFSFRQKN
jgi:hypothetical protein